ncbi:gamma-glutamyl hydrolase [Drosophila elegans]|uniref:gamma-glutamyl hydrolase n=1 Tax=Drosophila elegans TaxID=30023 RepID=UPI0007E690A3|nr:gamma-glutamyl hydrolase [Drosophila elegans]
MTTMTESASPSCESRYEIPTIGVMCIDIASTLQKNYGRKFYSYIATSYVKLLEASGAHVVPIWIGRDRAYYESMMGQLNGILLPGGAVFIDEADRKARPDLTSDCVRSAEHIYQLAMERNQRARKQDDAGGYFPIWGTCLGFQLLLIHAAEDPRIRSDCQPMRKAMPVKLVDNYQKSQLFKSLPHSVAEEMEKLPFACHQHRYCITKESLESCAIANDWSPLATQKDPTGLEFITIIEHRRFPIFGCQFHPERAAFEQRFNAKDLCYLAHSSSGIELSQIFGSRFVDVCRRNTNRFDTPKLKARHLIWNWQPVFSGQFEDSNWLQCYLFEKDVNYPEEQNESVESTSTDDL